MKRLLILLPILVIIPSLAFAELSNGMEATVVIGQPDFATGSSGTTSRNLNLPRGIYVDQNRLFVLESGNNRMLIWNKIPTSNYTPADIVVGQDDFVSSGASVTQSTLSNPRAGMTIINGKMNNR